MIYILLYVRIRYISLSIYQIRTFFSNGSIHTVTGEDMTDLFIRWRVLTLIGSLIDWIPGPLGHGNEGMKYLCIPYRPGNKEESEHKHDNEQTA